MATDKKENFNRIANARLEKITKSISSLEILTNRSFYEYTEVEINWLFDEIQKELDSVRSKFSKTAINKKKIRL